MILYGADSADHVPKGLFRIRKRQQIVEAATIDTDPAQVVGHQRRLDVIDQEPQAPQVIAVQRVGGADRKRHAVQGDGVISA